MPDQLAPNPVGLAPNGDIVVPGIELPEATGAPGPPNTLGWYDSSGVQREYVQGHGTGIGPGNQHVLAASGIADDTNYAELDLFATQQGTAGESVIQGTAQDTDGHASAVMIASNGQSSFVQLPAQSKTVVCTEVVSLGWPGGTDQTSQGYTHGQPVPVSALYFVTYVDTAGNTSAFTQIRSYTADGCVIDVFCTSGNPANGNPFALLVLAVLQY